MRGMLHPETESRRFMATVLPMVEKPAGMNAETQTPPIEHQRSAKIKTDMDFSFGSLQHIKRTQTETRFGTEMTRR